MTRSCHAAGAQAGAPAPTPDPADASWITLAKGEPMPGVELELRMPSVTLRVWVGGPHYVTARAEARINP